MVEEKKPVKVKYVVGEISTQTERVIVDTSTEEQIQYDVLTALTKLLNDVAEIKKTVC